MQFGLDDITDTRTMDSNINSTFLSVSTEQPASIVNTVDNQDESPVGDSGLGHVRGVACIMIAIVSVCGNSLVTCTIMYSQKLRENVNNHFVANLALADASFALLVLIPLANWYLVGEWNLGEFLCRIHLWTKWSIQYCPCRDDFGEIPLCGISAEV